MDFKASKRMETFSQYAVAAAKEACADAGFEIEKEDPYRCGVIIGSGIGSLQQIEKQYTTILELSLIHISCSGFVYAYNTAQAYIAAGMYQNILVIGSETLSGIVNWKDRGSCILFGDGAGAAVICAEEGEIFPAVTHSDGAKGQVLACESRQQKNWQDKENEKQTYVSMDGQAVFKFAVKKVPEVIGELLQKADLTEKDIDLFVLHQANLRRCV